MAAGSLSYIPTARALARALEWRCGRVSCIVHKLVAWKCRTACVRLWASSCRGNPFYDIQEVEGIGPVIALTTWPNLLRAAMWLHFIDPMWLHCTMFPYHTQ